eukprot:3697347-Alexandrium_andersonii.AAC.1
MTSSSDATWPRSAAAQARARHAARSAHHVGVDGGPAGDDVRLQARHGPGAQQLESSMLLPALVHLHAAAL